MATGKKKHAHHAASCKAYYAGDKVAERKLRRMVARNQLTDARAWAEARGALHIYRQLTSR